MVTHDSTLLRVNPRGSTWLLVVHVALCGSTWSHVVLCDSTWLLVAPRGSTLLHMVLCDSTWFHVATRGSTLFHAVARVSRLFHAVPRCSTWFHVVPRGSRWLHIVSFLILENTNTENTTLCTVCIPNNNTPTVQSLRTRTLNY